MVIQRQPTSFHGPENATIIYTDNMNNITEFYRGANIFLTGGTGFVGKALIEKLLRTCYTIETISVLIRPKRGKTVQQRLNELFESSIFRKIKEQNPNIFEKVKPISGDVSLSNLGISENHRQELIEHTNIVIHSAATVKFNENLKTAIMLNTLGTKRVLELCEEMKKLKSFVHVSTAYSNADKTVVDEIVYNPPQDPYALSSCINILPEEIINFLEKSLLKSHPNTYTFTKAMAEYLVLQSSNRIPSAIVRPSVIAAAWKEPFPGWIDNISGGTGIFMEIGRGAVGSVLADENNVMDMIPIDIVVNTILTAAWNTVAHRNSNMRVYNCTSGCINTLTYKQFRIHALEYLRKYPSKYVVWYPSFYYTSNFYIHLFITVFQQFLPATILDISLFCMRQKPMMLKIAIKFYLAMKVVGFFTQTRLVFKTSTMSSLVNAVKKAEDGDKFEIDIQRENGFDWNEFTKNYALGVRQYVLRDGIGSLDAARRKLKRLLWLQKFILLLKFSSTLATVFWLLRRYF